MINEKNDALKESLNLHPLNLEALDCPLCHSLLYEPITTSCGHSFCKDCILRAMDHDNKCPMCRNILNITPEYGVSVILSQILAQLYPEEYKLRKEEKEKELNEQKFNLPLFLLGPTILCPTASLPLHVFEPRYRLLIRRCLEGGKRFGIVPTINGNLAQMGTVAYIENHFMFPDGRSLVATTGEKRFKILETWDQDGYTIAKVEYIEDELVSEESKSRIEAKFIKAKDLTKKKLSSILPQVEEKIQPMPEEDFIAFVWWIVSIAPIKQSEKYNILTNLSPEGRLDIVIKKLEEITTNEFQCRIS